MAVIFDLDGTLTKRDTYIPFLGLCIRELGLRNLSALTLPFYALLYLTKLISNHQLKETFLKKILAGVSLKELESVSDKFVSNLLETGLNESVFSLLKSHIEQGDSVILATASFDFYVIKLAQKLRIRKVLCTKAEVNNGAITGRIFGKNCHGQEKVKKLEKIFGRHGWAAAIAYSDHYSDYPLLKRANKSYLVKPNVMTRLKLKKYKISVIN